LGTHISRPRCSSRALQTTANICLDGRCRGSSTAVLMSTWKRGPIDVPAAIKPIIQNLFLPPSQVGSRPTSWPLRYCRSFPFFVWGVPKLPLKRPSRSRLEFARAEQWPYTHPRCLGNCNLCASWSPRGRAPFEEASILCTDFVERPGKCPPRRNASDQKPTAFPDSGGREFLLSFGEGSGPVPRRLLVHPVL